MSEVENVYPLGSIQMDDKITKKMNNLVEKYSKWKCFQTEHEGSLYGFMSMKMMCSGLQSRDIHKEQSGNHQKY